jgi:hypothetical protein
MAGLAGAHRQTDGQVRLPGAGWAEEDHVVLGDDEVERAEVSDDLAFEGAGVVEVELLQALAGREAGGADPALPAVGFAGGDLALQTGDEEFLVRPGLRTGPLGQPGDRVAQRRRLQCPGQEHDLGGHIARHRGGRSRRGHHATPPSTPSAAS